MTQVFQKYCFTLAQWLGSESAEVRSVCVSQHRDLWLPMSQRAEVVIEGHVAVGSIPTPEHADGTLDSSSFKNP